MIRLGLILLLPCALAFGPTPQLIGLSTARASHAFSRPLYILPFSPKHTKARAEAGWSRDGTMLLSMTSETGTIVESPILQFFGDK